MFNDEFNGLPPLIRLALEDRIEEVVRAVYRRCRTAERDYTIPAYTAEEISGMIHSVFDLAHRIKDKIEAPE